MAEDISDILSSDNEGVEGLLEEEQGHRNRNHSDSDSDMEVEEEQVDRDVNNVYRPVERQHLWGWPRHQPHIANNADMVDELLQNGSLRMQGVVKAMKLCPRSAFVPGGIQHHPDVYVDAPIHVSGFGFNISAPHMHATCLQALDLQPGHKVLDVGSGSGILSAYAAVMVGKAGSVVGIDCQLGATKLARRNLRRLARHSQAFTEAAGECCFLDHNVFLPDVGHQGQYDRIVAGASCPFDKLPWLTALLKPQGGVLVTPVIPSELCRFVKHPDGTISSKVLSQVRFSNLELPKEVSVMKAFIEQERLLTIKPPVLVSTFIADVAAIQDSVSPGGTPTLGSVSSSSLLGSTPETPPSSWSKRLPKLFTACSSKSEDTNQDSPGGTGGSSPGLDPSWLGPSDCVLQGSNWSLPAHRSVLKNRSELFRAQCNSGMRDAEAAEMHVPEHFTKPAMETFLKYCYEDSLDAQLSSESVTSCLAVAIYYSAAPLVQLCELALAAKMDQSGAGAANLACHLLALSDEADLPHLQARALDFILRNHQDVMETAAYQALSKRQSDLVASCACNRLEHVQKLLDQMETGKLLAGNLD